MALFLLLALGLALIAAFAFIIVVVREAGCYLRRAFRVTLRSDFPCSRRREPIQFTGQSLCLREWVFVIEEALRMNRPSDDVGFAASYLGGDARRWFISHCENVGRPSNWSAFKHQLEKAYAPEHEREQCRFQFLRTRQTGSLEEYVTAFGRLSLDNRNVDELTRTLVFVEGLCPELKSAVRREHPRNVQSAIRAARTALEIMESDVPVTASASGSARADFPNASSSRSRPRCYSYGRIGHIAKFCRFRNSYPNVGRQ